MDSNDAILLLLNLLLRIYGKNIDKTFNWLKYKENSCRYDVFTLIYFLVLEEIIKKNLVKDNIKEVITF